MHSRLQPRILVLCVLLFLNCARAIAADAPREIKDIAYIEGEGGHEMQRLDIFLPADAGPHPLIVYVHGGAWRGGSSPAQPKAARSSTTKNARP